MALNNPNSWLTIQQLMDAANNRSNQIIANTNFYTDYINSITKSSMAVSKEYFQQIAGLTTHIDMFYIQKESVDGEEFYLLTGDKLSDPEEFESIESTVRWVKEKYGTYKLIYIQSEDEEVESLFTNASVEWNIDDDTGLYFTEQNHGITAIANLNGV